MKNIVAARSRFVVKLFYCIAAGSALLGSCYLPKSLAMIL